LNVNITCYATSPLPWLLDFYTPVYVGRFLPDVLSVTCILQQTALLSWQYASLTHSFPLNYISNNEQQSSKRPKVAYFSILIELDTKYYDVIRVYPTMTSYLSFIVFL